MGMPGLRGMMKARGAVRKKLGASKLKGVYWDVVKKTEGTIWAEEQLDDDVIKDLFSDISETFARKQAKAKKATGKEKKKQAVTFLDTKNRQNVDIGLARLWKGDITELAQAIEDLDADLIGEENVERLVGLVKVTQEFVGQAKVSVVVVVGACSSVLLLSPHTHYFHLTSDVQGQAQRARKGRPVCPSHRHDRPRHGQSQRNEVQD